MGDGDPAVRGVSSWLQAGTAREALDPRRPWGWHWEPERGESGAPVSVLTVFLVNRECPWECAFCDLARYTLRREVSAGDIPCQLDLALAQMRERGLGASHLKLYNAGSFFDPRAIPPQDHEAIAQRVASFERVIVECHPRLVGDPVWRFDEALRVARGAKRGDAAPGPLLEVAMGLETANPRVLSLQRKGITPELFGDRARELRARGLAVRAFVIIQPPHEAADQAVAWAARSVEFAVDCGVSVVSMIPFRAGPSRFPAPSAAVVESAFEAGISAAAGRARVFLDLWDAELWLPAGKSGRRRERLARMNDEQRILPTVPAEAEAGSSEAAETLRD